MENLIGTCIGQYEIQSLLGSGGTAVVYKALQKDLDRPVAIKMLRMHSIDPDELDAVLRRFNREIKMIASLRHPRILKVFNSGIHDGIPYLVMDFQPGRLTDLLIHQPMRLGLVVRLLTDIARALDYAHRRGILHRDVKPRNILLDEENIPYLTDFGLAKFQVENTRITREGKVIGTPSYMAPEMWKGLPLTPAVDIYALAITLFEMLTGDVPFTAPMPYQVMGMHIEREPPSILIYRPDLPSDMNRIIQRALAKEPKDRYQSAVELAEETELALRGLLVGSNADVSPPNRFENETASPAPIIISGAGDQFSRGVDQVAAYRIVRVLDRTESGVTVQAHDTTTDTQVSLKVVEVGPVPDQFIQSLKREAEDLKQLRHQNVARILDVGYHENKVYLASEYIPCTSLSDNLKLEQLGMRQIAEILNQVAAGLDYAHKNGVLHGDLSSATVLQNRDRAWVITQFGLINILDDYNRFLMETGLYQQYAGRSPVIGRDAAGAPGYLSAARVAPERWQGYPLSKRTDIYLLGLLLFEMLTGRLPFDGMSSTQIRQFHASSSPPFAAKYRRGVPQGVEAILQTALNADPRQRFASGHEMALAFESQISRA